MRPLATWCVRHRRAVLSAWLLALVCAFGLMRATGTDYSNTFSLPNTPSSGALSLLERDAPAAAGDTELVVLEARHGAKLRDPQVEARVTSMLSAVQALPGVLYVGSPYASAAGPGGGRIAVGGTIGYATVHFLQEQQNVSTKRADQFVTTVQRATTKDLLTAVSGQIAEKALRPSIGGLWIGVALAGVVLLVVFGSLFAMLLPLLSALLSLGTAIGLLGALSNVLKMPEVTSQLVLLIGLGVGIDYALFIVSRHRQGLMAGHDVEESAVHAVETSGRAVLFAGVIVCIALLGMFAIGISFLSALAVAAATGVALTMLSALTLLPAMLGFIGQRALGRRQRRRIASHGTRVVGRGTTGFWPRWAHLQSRRPLLIGMVALVPIVLVALPFLSMRLGTSDQGSDPAGTTTRIAYDLLAEGFGPGTNGPLQVVVVGRGATVPAVSALRAAIARQHDVASVDNAVTLTGRAGRVVLIQVVPGSDPQAAATTTLVDHLRDVTIPAVTSGRQMTVLVGGATAIQIDFGRVLASKLPLFIGLVVLLSFLLLGVVFRSLAIPLTAAAMNILSIGAALGVLVAVFQRGVLGSLVGVDRTGPIESYLPVMLFAILFGLSMDYEVFLLTRIHEEWKRCGDNRLAVRRGLAATGKTISAAALIMILIFASFILGGIRVIKEFGLGLAAGVFMDAVFIRMAVVPAVMFLLDGANWWFPRTLDRVLPRLAVDPPVEDDDLEAELPAAPEPATV